MKTTRPLANTFVLFIAISAISICSADSFNLMRFDINGSRIGDSQNHFLREMSADFPSKASASKHSQPSSLLYTKPISCEALKTGNSRCSGKFAEMTKTRTGQQKDFMRYSDVVADFNVNNELSFLSIINTTRHGDRKTCLNELSKFYNQTTGKEEKPTVIYPRNQLDIYYIKIDEQPFTTRMVGKLDSAFSMVWQKKRGDWSAFYSVDFGCRESGHMVVNSTLYDESKKNVSNSNSKLQISSFKTKI